LFFLEYSAFDAMEEILFKKEGRVAVIAFNRPDDENRMTLKVLERLGSIADDLAGDEETLAVILTGSGDEFFSAGMLHPKVRATLTREQILGMVRLANAVFDRIEALPQVVVAALNGVTRAGAAELTLACDMRLAASHATFAVPEAKWGGFPGAGAPVRLPGIVGRARALELICTGRELNAQEMESFGITLGTHAPDKLMAAAHDIAGRIAACGPLAIRGAKRIVNLRERAGFAAARELSDALRHALESTGDMAEGQAAILEGRAPRFKGR
jgi:enoyl-CoA hydratase/carnithine racemase